MSFAHLLVHDVTIQSATVAANRYGDEAKSWDDPTETTVKGWVSQRTGSEDHDGREAQVSDWIAYFHAGTAVTGANRVVWEGITFEVDGPVNPAWSPRGEHHLEVPLRVVTG